jgi:hypothetical protein
LPVGFAENPVEERGLKKAGQHRHRDRRSRHASSSSASHGTDSGLTLI